MRTADILKVGIALVAIQFACVSTQASWYWPFGSDDDDGKKKPPRLSELMEPASVLIDEASDLAAAGSNDVAVATYRKALVELDRIEKENPDRVKKPEFATLRNKRAYVNAAIDSMLLGQVKANARAVAVSDTTELEKRLAEERRQAKAKGEEKAKAKGEDEEKKIGGENRGTAAGDSKVESAKPSLRDQAIRDINAGDYAAAKLSIDEMLARKPNSPAALNLQAVMEIRQGKYKAAEATLDRCIANNPKSYFAYYNMCELYLRKGDPTGAKRYYETGRAYGGPKNDKLEKVLK